MEALLHNPIADMYGPNFLLLYGSVISLTLFGCWKLVQDPTTNQPLPLIPSEPDPYEVAYFREGVLEVVKVAILSLIQKNYLQITGEKISQTSEHENVLQLHPIEREVFFSYSTTPEAKSLWVIASKVVLYCDTFEGKLRNEQLLYAQEWQRWNYKVGLIAATIIFSLGGYKLLIALENNHHNVSLLIFMAVISIMCILWLSRMRSRLSYRGQVYLQQLQATFAQLKTKAKNSSFLSGFNYNLLVALFGVEALAGTEYDSYYKVFYPATSRTSSQRSNSSDSGCSSGSSCSGGSSCGGGCGGGCGGCSG
ncbi:hypothetical protein NIES37_15900 [Tolypothrix tenuis PCC 7101]|uniref:TIGR04222 domain-containing membrane protein n=1 Tax=Tolypothrix tenuis PCC 7101 TaxID=231146 RepID=A0A1Z4MVY2_9CYAN|nr:TIGR04222 domain-containing membrane protein [Aulosira sp. FACHB-113]BAY97646.1 hypothetical protein NIES37_15900 [Tolypothrix tenuis PCC 7101]BAZ71847.1 hypothetical protein NIES50_03940 [Aulosira laxa NIES-50]